MYQFKIAKVQEGGYKFELENIKILVDDYSITNGKHLLKTPNKSIAFFNIDQDVYGISNDMLNFHTAEELYDALIQQYKVFSTSSYTPTNKNTSTTTTINTPTIQHTA